MGKALKPSRPKLAPVPPVRRVASALALVALALLVASWAVSRARASRAPRASEERYVWKNVAVLGGGFVTGIVFNPTERDLVYARTDVGGAYRWDAGLRAWAPLLDWIGQPDWNLQGVESLATDPVEPKRVYIAAGTYTNQDVGNGEILSSTDQGRTWRRTPMPLKMGANEAGRGSGERLVVDPHQGSVLFFGSRRDGLWQSADHAATWHKVEGFPNLPDGSVAYQQEQANPQPGRFNYLAQAVGIVFVRFDPASGGPGEPTPTIYAAISRTGESLFRSRDAGATWEPVPGQPVAFRPNRADLSSSGALFVTYGDEPGPNRMGDGAVFKLDTRTGAWTNVTPEKPGTTPEKRFGYAAVCVDPQDPATVVVTTWHRGPSDDIYRSRDGGATWTTLLDKATWDHAAAPYTSTMHHHWMSSIAIDPFEPNHMLFTTGFGIWATRNATDASAGRATRWSFDDQGLEETVPLALVSPSAGAHLVSGLGDIDGFRHDDLGVSPPNGRFDAPGYKNTEWLDVAGRAPGVLVRSGTTYGNDRILGAYSRDGAVHWKGFPSEPPRVEPSDRFGTGPIAVSADGRVVVWTPRHNRPYVTSDDGVTWRPVGGAPVDLAMVADRVDPARFYGYDAGEGVLYLSMNGGGAVQVVRRGLPVPHGSRGQARGELRAVPDRPGELWLAVDKALFHLTATWGFAADKITSVEEVTSVGFGKAAARGEYPTIFAVGEMGGRFGIFRSDDRAANWVRITDDAHGYGSASHVTGDPRVFGRVYFATGGRGIVYGDVAP
jgi:hypothetical protein